MTQDSSIEIPTEGGWDDEENQVPEAISGENNIHLGNDSINASGSWINMGSYAPTTATYYNVATDSVTIDSNALNLASTTITYGPTVREQVIEPEYIVPLMFTFEQASWKYVFVTILSMLIAPAMILWSKLTRRPAGIRVRNPAYRR